MEITPSQITAADFRTVRKGYDPAQVEEFLGQVAAALESAQQRSTAMEARARAAVARLEEATARRADEPDEIRAAPDEVETISRTLLLAQRTADTTIAEAEVAAAQLADEARHDATAALDAAREQAAGLIEEARVEARRAGEAEREAAANEVEALRARREFLIGDVDQLERFLVDQRERLRSAARDIESLCERVPSGLGSVRPPVLSAADDDTGGIAPGDDADLDETVELVAPIRSPDVTSDPSSGGDDRDRQVLTGAVEADRLGPGSDGDPSPRNSAPD
jgi:DivIVA domain-containing protein